MFLQFNGVFQYLLIWKTSFGKKKKTTLWDCEKLEDKCYE